MSGATRRLAGRALDYRYEGLSADARAMGMRCLLDGIACAVAGLDDPASRIVADEVREQGGIAEATLFGTAHKVPAGQAALANGTATHALDYDDVNVAIPGHATAVVMPALLALAEATRANGRDVVTAFIAGYETACRVGLLVAPGHYERGFHATATAGAIGAAAACSRLLGFSRDQAAGAIALAATQASGLKAMFGNMAKPLHAGAAARNALLAVKLVARGFEAGDDALEHPQGFAKALSGDLKTHSAMADADGSLILRNLFKYHAACYGTQSAIECANRLRAEHRLESAAIARATVTSNPASDKYCNIAAPRNCAEGKFSLRLNAAFGLLGVVTSRLDAYSDASVLAPDAVDLRDRIDVTFDGNLPMMKSIVAVTTKDGKLFTASYDAGEPETDYRVQQARVEAKFLALTGPVLGRAAAEGLRAKLLALEGLAGVGELIKALRR